MSLSMNPFSARRSRGRRLIVSVCAGLALAGATAGVALGSSSGTVSDTINVAVRSLTVSPTSVSMCTPSSPLTFPNGQCSSPNITVANGQAGGDHIQVQGTNAVPSDVVDHGQSPPDWALCFGAGCGTSGHPGGDQYSQQTETTSILQTLNQTFGVALSTTPTCDFGFGGDQTNENCLGAAGESVGETLLLTGPTSSTDQSPTFSSAVTWTAAP